MIVQVYRRGLAYLAAEAPLAVFSFWVARDAELVGAAAQRYFEARASRPRVTASSREP